jgi:hypothetical protein
MIREQENHDELTIPNYIVPPDEISENIDIPDLGNEFACAIYAEEVYNYLKEMEVYYNSQKNINFSDKISTAK